MSSTLTPIVLLLGAFACATHPNARASASSQPEVRTSAVDAAVHVTARIATPKPGELNDDVTALNVDLENTGDRAVRVHYRDFVVTGESQRPYSAVAPFDVDDNGALNAEPMNPLWVYRSFEVSPVYAPIYAGVPVYNGGVPKLWYENAGPASRRFWPSRKQPTATMLGRAIPEGLLQPGGRLSGLVYFDCKTSDASVLKVTLTSEPDDRPLATSIVALTPAH